MAIAVHAARSGRSYRHEQGLSSRRTTVAAYRASILVPRRIETASAPSSTPPEPRPPPPPPRARVVELREDLARRGAVDHRQAGGSRAFRAGLADACPKMATPERGRWSVRRRHASVYITGAAAGLSAGEHRSQSRTTERVRAQLRQRPRSAGHLRLQGGDTWRAGPLLERPAARRSSDARLTARKNCSANQREDSGRRPAPTSPSSSGASRSLLVSSRPVEDGPLGPRSVPADRERRGAEQARSESSTTGALTSGPDVPRTSSSAAARSRAALARFPRAGRGR
jgi:hypothetical protein